MWKPSATIRGLGARFSRLSGIHGHKNHPPDQSRITGSSAQGDDGWARQQELGSQANRAEIESYGVAFVRKSCCQKGSCTLTRSTVPSNAYHSGEVKDGSGPSAASKARVNIDSATKFQCAPPAHTIGQFWWLLVTGATDAIPRLKTHPLIFCRDSTGARNSTVICAKAL